MEYKCNSCREVSALSPKAKFCPICGSTSLILVVKEQAEPTQKETVGVYKTATADHYPHEDSTIRKDYLNEVAENTEPSVVKEEEDQPRRKR